MPRAVIIGIVAAALSGGEIFAGAWPQPEGRFIVIVTSAREIAPVGGYFGDPVDSDTNSTQLFGEYGVTPDLTVGITVYGEFSTTEDVVEARIGGHVRRRVWTGTAGDVLSVQGGASFPVERWLGNGLGDERPQSASEVDMRLLYGRGWQWGLGDSFVSGELGLRIRGERLDEELRADLTLGHTPIDGVLALLGIFATEPLGARGEASLKIAPSLAYTYRPLLGSNDLKPDDPVPPSTIQLGLSWDALARDDGVTLALSVWKRF